MEHFLAEKYLPGGAAARLADDASLLRALVADEPRVVLLHSLYLPGEELCFHVFASDSQELVAQLSSRIGADRIVPAVAL